MATPRRHSSPTPESIASYVAKNADKVRKVQAQDHQGMESVREAEYQGHRIVVRTHYEIEVDGRMVMGHIGVTNDGQVHYHPVPNLSFASAVEMVEKLIDIFPEDFVKKGPGNGQGHGHGRRTAGARKGSGKGTE
jgi:hypothetical protein